MAKKPQRHVTPLEAATAYEKTLARENKRKFSQEQPDDVMPDPRLAVPVSRQGKDKGAIAREVDIVLIADPLQPGREIEMPKVRDGLSRMFKEGSISEPMFRVGAVFQYHYGRCGYEHYASAPIYGLSGGRGGEGIEGKMDGVRKSQKIVDKLLNCVGGRGTQMGKAVCTIVGDGVGLKNIARMEEMHGFSGGNDFRYWRGILVAALEIMAQAYAASDKAKRSGKMRGQLHFQPDEVEIKEGRVYLRQPRG